MVNQKYCGPGSKGMLINHQSIDDAEPCACKHARSIPSYEEILSVA